MDSLGSAQGAVDSLLGTLGSLIKDEAQLLGNVRGDVQFISDEMESMNGFLLHVDEATESEDHQVRAWMKQVRDVAVESERWVDRYLRWEGTTPRGGGLLGFVRRIPHSLGTIRERHEIATKIQELKSRAHQVGERRQRYGVEVPSKMGRRVQDVRSRLGREDETEEQYAWRRCLEALRGEGPKNHDMTEEDKNNIVRRMKLEKDIFIAVAGLGDFGKNILTEVFEDSSIAAHFDCKLWIPVSSLRERDMEENLGNQLFSVLGSRSAGLFKDEDPATRESQYGVQADPPPTKEEKYLRLNGKRFFIVLESSDSAWTDDRCAIFRTPWLARSVVILILKSIHDRFLGSRSFDFTKPVNIEVNRAISLVEKTNTDKAQVLMNIIHKLLEGPNCLEMLFHILHVNPNRALDKLQFLCDSLKRISIRHIPRHIPRQVRRRPDVSPHDTSELLLFSYKDLPNDSKRCLLYLSIFPPGCRIRRTGLVRRWVAEGLITRRAGLNALDAADRCFRALVDEGLLQSVEIGMAGKVKTIVVPSVIYELNMQDAIAHDFEGLYLPPYLGVFLSIGGGIQLLSAPKVRRRRDSWSEFLQSIICNCKGGVPAASEYAPAGAIVSLLESLPKFERNGLLKVVDIPNVTGLQNKRIMKNICQVSELRYLNLRGSDVTELPEDIDKMQNLETLDIRQTKVKVLPPKAVFLRKLQHMLSGSIEPIAAGNDWESNESFSAVRMPHGTGGMTAMQILSHVEVSSGNTARSINDFHKLISSFERLQKLRKLGVLVSGKKPQLRSLLHEIGKLDKSLRSLSIQFNPPDREDNNDDNGAVLPTITLPRLLESIKLSGFRDGLPSWVLNLSKLEKVTLQDIFLKTDDLQVQGLADLASLCGLRLRFVRYASESNETNLHIARDKFVNLKNLILEHTNITDISFEEGAAPKLKMMYWNSNKVNSISGMEYLKGVNQIGFLDCTVGQRVKAAIRGNIDTTSGKSKINFYDRFTRNGVQQDREEVPPPV